MTTMDDRKMVREVALALDILVTAEAARMIEKAPMPDCLRRSGLAVYLGISVAALALEHDLSGKQIRELLQTAIELRPEVEQHNPVGEVRELGPMTAEQANARIDAMQQTMAVEAPAPHEEEKRK